ncbi:ABC transporter ATP-binding protein [Streptomyces afghaniensis]|uniref:ABC transporter ATP-binding protein n=1 Tax=Streptomyces afghaniensis TaxID=66865 RepID=UPI002783784A|nr:ABC transporter ATP-binding protein [Streptomyces afghaniensis]MDQ1015508.1 hypothetical protein [Streptomyces afghaniensis]
MTASERLAEAQQNVCNTFFALAGAADDAEAIREADEALWALDALLAEPGDDGPREPAG